MEPTVPDLILRLALPSPLRRLFDYLPPAGVSEQLLQPGVRLRVPFGRREVIAVLIERASHSSLPADKLRPALALLDRQPLLPASLFRLCQWTAQYYQHSLGDTFSWAQPVLLRQGEAAEVMLDVLGGKVHGANILRPSTAMFLPSAGTTTRSPGSKPAAISTVSWPASPSVKPRQAAYCP